MANWLIKSAPSTNVFPVSSNNQTQDSLPLPSRERIQAHLSTEALECCLAEQINWYQSSSRKISPQTQKINKAKSKLWSELNLAISIAVQHSQQKLKKNPRYKYLDSIIANLYEFNNLRLQYTLSGIPNPSLTASLETAISSIRWAPPPDPTKPPIPRSGIYQARQIAQHATYILNFKEIKNPKDGNKTNHKSILDNIQLRREIFQWASTQAVGAVSLSNLSSHQIICTSPNDHHWIRLLQFLSATMFSTTHFLLSTSPRLSTGRQQQPGCISLDLALRNTVNQSILTGMSVMM
jgi:hypothetical protein